ncbi:hypothetical protein ACIGMX_11370 [Streptomyces aquilus]|uniref:Uncharacterized protein n=1 Tax=Streptomyces aquilus TaxID=2548456 RepID=A0A3Q9C1X0_9ACTN|nr:hypothetical protein [Streptomyces aquilus]AZP19764.1 hypothetical protein EJC51_29070 [Streptomyces aquilus]
MTAERSRGPLAVYRLMPSMNEFRTLSLEEYAHRKLIRWLRTGSPEDLPESFRAEWVGNPRLRRAEFPCGYPGAPVFSRRVADLLAEQLSAAGRYLPVYPEDTDGQGEPGYLLHLVEKVVDCVDTRRSSKPKKGTGQMKQTFFVPDALPAELPAFRVPEFPGGVHWNGWAVDRLKEILGDDLEARLIWSEDRTRTPHPAPWGF